MYPNNPQRTSWLLFISVFLFACSTYICSYTVPQFLLEIGLTSVESDHIESIELLGYIIAGLILVPIINRIHRNKTMIMCLSLMIICTLNIMILEGYEVLKINFIIMSAAYYAYLITLIIKILEVMHNSRYLAMFLFSICWILGHFVAHYMKDLLPTSEDSLLICILLYVITVVTCLPKEVKLKFTPSAPSFSFLISNIELQVLTGFMVSYVTFEILWYYEDFAIQQGLTLSKMEVIIHYMLMSIFFAAAPAVLILKRMNKYLVNLIAIIVLLITFYLLGFYVRSFVSATSFLCIISVSLSLICICNILILSDKFESQDFRTAITIYCTMCAIGMFAGALSTDSASKEDHDFLFSTFAVVGTFVIYYLWYFVKRKLYK